jgi:hypothetical protein
MSVNMDSKCNAIVIESYRIPDAESQTSFDG